VPDVRLAGPLLEEYAHDDPSSITMYSASVLSMPQAAMSLNLPMYWLTHPEAERKRRGIPHYRVGKLVRFKLGELRLDAAPSSGRHRRLRRCLISTTSPTLLRHPTAAHSVSRSRRSDRADGIGAGHAVPAGKKRKGQIPHRRRAGQPRRQPRGRARWREGGLWTDRATGDGGDIFDLIAAISASMCRPTSRVC
jgi:hypothetical protein